jgi:hypothetical protein
MSNSGVFRRHWVTVLVPAVVGTLSLGGLLALTVTCMTRRIPWLILIPAMCGLIWATGPLVSWGIHRVVVTADGRLICREGVIARQTCVPLRLAALRTHTNLMGRMLNYGTLEIDGDPPHVLEYLAPFNELQRMLAAENDGPLSSGPMSGWPVDYPAQAVDPLGATPSPGARTFKSGSGKDPLRTGPVVDWGRYRRFISFCESLMHMPEHGRRSERALLTTLSDEQLRFVAVLARSGLLRRGTWRWAERIRNLDDVRRRIGPLELERALAGVQFRLQYK